jgi:hypothetical protein
VKGLAGFPGESDAVLEHRLAMFAVGGHEDFTLLLDALEHCDAEIAREEISTNHLRGDRLSYDARWRS